MLSVNFFPKTKVSTENVQNPSPRPFINAKFVSDTVSFTSNSPVKKFSVNLDESLIARVAKDINGGTSGYRAKFNKVDDGKTFNKEVVKLITQAVCAHNIEESIQPGEKPNYKTIMVGGDTREASKQSLPQIVEQLTNNGFNVIYAKNSADKESTGGPDPVPTPLLALATREMGIGTSILLTASHNPWEDGGFNLITQNATIAPPDVTQKVAKQIEEIGKGKNVNARMNIQKGTVSTFDPYELYKKHLDENINIDWKAIKDSNIHIVYDGLEGTGTKYFPQLLRDHGVQIKDEDILNSQKNGPNPVAANLTEVAEKVKNSGSELKIGLATDGDSDRFGIIDEKGNFLSATDVLMLALYHQAKNGKVEEGKGSIIHNHATSAQLKSLADKYKLDTIVTPVGFKFIGEKMLEIQNSEKPAVLCGESSGGLTVKGHIPEKDGFVALLTILELVAKEKKPLSEILVDAKKEAGSQFKFVELNYKFDSSDKKIAFVEAFNKYLAGEEKEFGGLEIDADATKKFEEYLTHEFKKDGTKIFFNDGSSMLIRMSGTENADRVYLDIAGKNEAEAQDKFNKVQAAVIEVAKKFGAK